MMNSGATTEIEKLQQEISEKIIKVQKLHKEAPPVPVENYRFKDLNGEVSLSDLFAGKDTLFAIHNMGQGCRYCTTWADGINPFLPHLEDKYSVVLLSKDEPETQRRFANSRGWRFRTASHGGGAYIKDQSVVAGQGNQPGMVVYFKKGNQIFKKNSAVFGPGDLYCSIWHMLSLAGVGEGEFVPQYNYWARPAQMDDGGANVR
ncbi:MAG: DUF899 family protein [Bdellovibrionia bacterium]